MERPKPAPPAPPVIAAPVKEPPPRPTVISNPDWLRKPNGDDFQKFYPERADRLQIGGRAEISCVVTAQGTLDSCSVVSEDPSDQEFGTQALKMAKLFKMRPKTRDGAPVGGATINIPIRFTPAPKD
ncbi:MAG: energy transducer TonB [Pseudomonadota bacterium]|nr:energy transducer TonB [Pseudomonadota bacterium]